MAYRASLSKHCYEQEVLQQPKETSAGFRCYASATPRRSFLGWLGMHGRPFVCRCGFRPDSVPFPELCYGLHIESQAMRPDLALHRRQSGDKQLSSAGVVSPAHLHSLALVCIELCQSAELSPTQAMLSSTELADILCRKMCVCIMSCEVSSESEKT
ncbi:hypothetical protein ABBQ32_012522 [Trebouxia sp. C0010 RCD-2024]